MVSRTADRGGKVLIPAFSLGRTQVVAHYLGRWMGEGVLPELPVYVDSPLAAQIADVHEMHTDSLGVEPAGGVEYLGDPEEAEELSGQREPCVIVASGGMCEGGRIVRHLRRHVDDPRSAVVLVSYQAPHSVGARLPGVGSGWMQRYIAGRIVQAIISILVVSMVVFTLVRLSGVADAV